MNVSTILRFLLLLSRGCTFGIMVVVVFWAEPYSCETSDHAWSLRRWAFWFYLSDFVILLPTMLVTGGLIVLFSHETETSQKKKLVDFLQYWMHRVYHLGLVLFGLYLLFVVHSTCWNQSIGMLCLLAMGNTCLRYIDVKENNSLTHITLSTS